MSGVATNAAGKVILPPDRFFDPWLTVSVGPAERLVRSTIMRVQTQEAISASRARKRKAQDQQTFEAMVEAVVANMLVVIVGGDSRGTAVDLSKDTLSRASRYRSPAQSKNLSPLLKLMATPEIGLIDLEPGRQMAFTHRNQRTLIWPTRRLRRMAEEQGVRREHVVPRASEEVIILKDSKLDYWTTGERLEYDDTLETVRFRSNLAQINQAIASAAIEVDHSRLLVPGPIDTADRRLKRIFNRGDRSFNSGGRFFGGFWQRMPKRERLRSIWINGEPVVGLDFSQMAPRTAYGLVGATPPAGDMYAIPDVPSGHRGGMKALVNAMLSTETPLTRKPKGTKHILPDLHIETLCGAVEAHHAPIRHLFYTGACHRLQFIESQVMEQILLNALNRQIVVLPIHDGLLAPRSDGDEVERMMRDAAMAIALVDVPVEPEG